MEKNLWKCLALSCVIGLAPLAYGDQFGVEAEEGLESLLFMEVPVVTVAAISKQKVDEVPGTVTVITHDDIKYQGFQSLIEVLNIVPGFNTYFTAFGSSNLNSRRYNNDWGNQKVLIDGHSVNGNFYHQINPYEFFPLDNVKQIEIIRGPGSCLYGTDAFSAVINIVTDKSQRSTLSAQGGQFNRQGYNAAHYSDPDQGFSYSASLDYFKEDGDSLTYEKDWLQGTGMSYAPNTQEAAKERLGAHLGLKYKDLELNLRHADNERAWTEGYVNIQGPEDSWVYSGLNYLELKDQLNVSDTSSLQFKASYDSDFIDYEGHLFPPDFNWLYIYGIPDINFDGIADNWPNGSSFDSQMEASRYQLEALYQAQAGNHGLSVGAEYGESKIGDTFTRTDFHNTFLTKVPLATYTIDSPVLDGVPVLFNVGEGATEVHWGAFLQDIWKINDTLSTVLGVRHDDYEDAGGTTSPRIAFVWNGFGGQTFKVSYGQAFTAPNNSQKYTSAFGYFGVVDLRPETIKTYDFSIQNAYENPFHYVVTFYSSKTFDHIVRDSNRRPSYNNTDGSQYDGIELEGRWKAMEHLFLWGNYSLNGADEATGLVDDYQSLANLGGTFFLNPSLALSGFATFVGERDRDTTFNSEPIDGYTTLNLSLLYRGIPNVDLTLIAKNVLDEEYAYRNEIQSLIGLPSSDFSAEGRQIIVKGTYHWD